MTTYTYSASTGMATRSSDGASVPWDAANDRPSDPEGEADSRWVADGSPASIKAPSAPPPTPSVTGRQIFGQARAQGVSAAIIAFLPKSKPDDALYWSGISLDTGVPINNPKVGRVLVGAGVVNADGSSAVPAFMTAAAQLTA